MTSLLTVFLLTGVAFAKDEKPHNPIKAQLASLHKALGSKVSDVKLENKYNDCSPTTKMGHVKEVFLSRALYKNQPANPVELKVHKCKHDISFSELRTCKDRIKKPGFVADKAIIAFGYPKASGRSHLLHMYRSDGMALTVAFGRELLSCGNACTRDFVAKALSENSQRFKIMQTIALDARGNVDRRDKYDESSCSWALNANTTNVHDMQTGKTVTMKEFGALAYKMYNGVIEPVNPEIEAVKVNQ